MQLPIGTVLLENMAVWHTEGCIDGILRKLLHNIHADQDLLSVETGHFRSVLILSFSEFSTMHYSTLSLRYGTDFSLYQH